jgi:hypothetical protein
MRRPPTKLNHAATVVARRADQELTTSVTFSSARTRGSGCPVASSVFMRSRIQTQPSRTFPTSDSATCQGHGFSRKLPS